MSAPALPPRIPLVLPSKDPSFAALLENTAQSSPFAFLTSAGPAITLETVRTNAPGVVLLDLDSVDTAEASRLVLKLSLVSPAPVVLTGCETFPGHPSLDPLFAAGAHGALPKPEGKSSLGLVGEVGRIYLERLLHLLPPHPREGGAA